MAKPDSTACLHCGKAVAQTRCIGRIKKYCSLKCSQAVRVKPVVECRCAGCGSAFMPWRNDKRNKWCSDQCRVKHQPTQFKQGVTCTCARCSKAFIPTQNSRNMYCSRACAHKDMPRRFRATAELRRLRDREDKLERNAGRFCEILIRQCVCCESGLVGPKPNDTWAGGFCATCRKTLGNAIGTHPGRLDFLRSRLHGRECRICGNLFKPYQETTSVCSKACEKQTEEYKRLVRVYKLKRRARKRNNGPHHNIDPMAVFERDGWRCYLCGTDTPRSLRGTHDDCAPELDHIRPLSKNGTHTLDNVACACRKCNQDKSDRLMVRIGDLWSPIPASNTRQAIQFCLL